MDLNVQFYKMSKQMKTQLYLDNLTTIFNPQALFADGTEFYRCPSEPDPYDRVRLRLRCARENLDSVILVFNDERIEMEKLYNDRLFDYYETFVQLGTEQVFYYFEIHCGQMVCYYNNVGLCNSVEEYYNFTMTPGFHTPDWAKGAVFYQIYVDRFYNGDRSNDVEDNEYIYIGEGTSKVTDWNKYPAAMGVREFYGGDIAGVMQKLDYLQELGVEVIYLNPVFVSPSNHKYDIQDYDYIDPHFGRIVKDEGELLQKDEHGSWKADANYPNKDASRYICRVTDKENLEASNRLFAEFVEEVHRRGMKVILDGVFNHCGSFNKWLDRECIYENAEGYEKGAFVSEDSPYNTFFKFRERQWPYNPHYDGWWGHDTLPKLNYEESPALFDYIMHVGRKWVSPPYNVDGWRLDVAADLGQSGEYNHYFWKEFRRNVKEANPNALILAEHYGDPTEWLKGDEWDTVMNYDAFMEPLTWFLTGVEKHSDEYRQDQLGNPDSFFGSMRHFMTRFHTQSLQVAMNELSNHDHSRFLTRTNGIVGRAATRGTKAAEEGVNYGIFREAVVVQMTWPGAPTVYYGDEAGVCGFTDPDNRRSYPWGHEDVVMIDFHRDMIRIHKENEALRTGSVKFLQGEKDVLAYGRFNRKQQFVVILNNSEDKKEITQEVWTIGIPKKGSLERLIITTEAGYSLMPKDYPVEDGRVTVTLMPHSAVVLKYEQE